MKNHILVGNMFSVVNFFEYFDVIFNSSYFSINEPWENFSGFLGRSLSTPLKLIGESTIFAKKAIGGFGRPKGGCCGGGTIGIFGGPPSGWSGGRAEKDDELLHGSG